MKLNLRTKLTLATATLVLAVVAAISVAFLADLMKHVIRQAEGRAAFVAQEVFLQAQQALNDAASHGEAPTSASAADLRAYVRQVLESNTGWNSAVRGALGYSPSLYEITVSDTDGNALVSSDVSLPGKPIHQRPEISSLVHSNFYQQLSLLYGPPRVYEFRLPFNLGIEPFGSIRVAVSTSLLRNEVSPGIESAGWFALVAVLLSTFLAFVLSRATLAPVQRISAQLDRISAGEPDTEIAIQRADEFGQVSTKISRIGRELRDVREVFSTLRENLNQIMAQLEDGVLLFNNDGRIMLASKSVSLFLGIPASDLSGHTLAEIMSEAHPLRRFLDREGSKSASQSEIVLPTDEGPRRVEIHLQPVTEANSRMGTLVTLRDMESRERIGSELRVSEHLATIGRVTAGVAHEVKNPLNSMRVWLEVLKTNLPSDPEPQEAAHMLDSEIGRLDRVVKTFLDFTRPVQLEMNEVDLSSLLDEAMANAKPTIDRAHVQAIVNLEPGIPPVKGDRQLLLQSFLNLIWNACDAMQPGGTLRVDLRRDGEMAEATVSDTGKGILPQNRNKIFQLYFTTRQGGTGIGLANTFRFVQLHGGSIEFDSEPGSGTTFRIRLPLASPAQAGAVETPEPAQTATRTA